MTNINYESFKRNYLIPFLYDLAIEWNHQDIKFPNQKHTLQEWIVIKMKEIVIENLEMIRCSLNNEYVLLANCCYCNFNANVRENESYIYCNYKP